MDKRQPICPSSKRRIGGLYLVALAGRCGGCAARDVASALERVVDSHSEIGEDGGLHRTSRGIVPNAWRSWMPSTRFDRR
jgi:hypothetical protein